MIGVGDIVVAIRPGGRDPDGLPMQRPEVGKTYRVTSIYRMPYGLGCTLKGMDPSPYRGYFLFVKKGRDHGWYFKKIEVADPEFTQTFYEFLRSKKHGQHTEEPVASERGLDP